MLQLHPYLLMHVSPLQAKLRALMVLLLKPLYRQVVICQPPLQLLLLMVLLCLIVRFKLITVLQQPPQMIMKTIYLHTQQLMELTPSLLRRIMLIIPSPLPRLTQPALRLKPIVVLTCSKLPSLTWLPARPTLLVMQPIKMAMPYQWQAK